MHRGAGAPTATSCGGLSLAIPIGAIERTLRVVVDMLVRGDCDGLEELTRGIRLPSSEIRTALAEYGRTLCPPPSDAYSRTDVVPIQRRLPRAYSIRFRLFTIEEGESDLELQATLIERPASEMMTVELDNIRVP
jgi:hypothetical protein